MRRGTAFGIVIVAMAASSLGSLLATCDAPLPPPDPSIAEAPYAAAALAADPMPRVESAHARADDAWWLPSLGERAPEPLEAAADGDPRAVTVYGRLTVRERPWIHPAGVPIRVVRSWLDTVLPADAGDQDAPPPDPAGPRTMTDAEGRFALTFVPDRGELFFLIDQRGEWSDVRRVPDVPRPGTALDLGCVFLDDRGGIEGQIVGFAGSPIAGVEVRAIDDPLAGAGTGLEELCFARDEGLEAFRPRGTLASGPVPAWVARRDRFLPFPRATSDATGRFRLAGVRPGTHGVFFTHATGSRQVTNVLVAGQRSTDLGRVDLRPNRERRLRFVDERRRPWVGAEVAALPPELGFGPPVVRTDAHGHASLVVLGRGAPQLVFAFPGGGPWLLLPMPPHEDQIVVPRTVPFRVTVVDERGAPVRDGRVRCFVQGEAFRAVDRALPEAMQPRETAPGVHEGNRPDGLAVVAVANAPGFAPAIAAVAAREATLRMLPLQHVTVRTHDLHDRPVAGATVRIQAHAHPDLDFPGAQWDLLANDRVRVGTTDEQGLLTVPVWPTFLSFEADHPDFPRNAGPKLVPAAGQRIDLLLRRGATVHGHLTFQERRAGAGWRIRARQRPPPGHVLEGSGWRDAQLAVTGDDGAFALRGLCAGIWELQPELPEAPAVGGPQGQGRAFRTREVLLDEDEALHLVLEAELAPLSTRQIEGAVTRDGMLAAGALVRVRRLDARAAAAEAGDANAPVRREDARYRERMRDRSLRSRKLGGPRDDDDLGGAAPTAAAAWDQRLVTDVYGDFAFGGLEPDTEYELRLDVPSLGRLQFLERRVVRTPGTASARPIRVEFAIRTGALALQLDGDRGPFRNRLVRLRQVDGKGQELARYDLLSGADGSVRVDDLPTGVWTIEPALGGRCVPAEFEVAPGATTSDLLRVEGG